MANHTVKILKYEAQNMVRSKWLLTLSILLFVVSESLFQFGGDPAKTVTSLMNVVLIIVPLMSVVLGTIFFYNSREFNELLLAQPIDRTSIYLGKLIGFSGALCGAFLVGMLPSFLIHSVHFTNYVVKIVTLLAVGCCFIVIFASVSFYAATRFEDRIKGLGSTLLVWFLFSVVWDGLILLFVHIFQDYPYEPALMGLIFVNPIDLGRILILLQMDIAALLGYTGALFRSLFGTDSGIALCALAMVVYATVPLWLGVRLFRRKDF